ncbi:hypothetical protein [Peribacillus sp. NPDC096448]|uniref:hypothetical protein n=1 Tax=Peribacillus sp. NPDC096448 TaxID=3364395 RepID=UPI00380AD3A5
MGEEHIVNRWIIYCPYTQRYVDHEISFVGTDEKKERIATGTGIDDCCRDCVSSWFSSLGWDRKEKIDFIHSNIQKNKIM